MREGNFCGNSPGSEILQIKRSPFQRIASTAHGGEIFPYRRSWPVSVEGGICYRRKEVPLPQRLKEKGADLRGSKKGKKTIPSCRIGWGEWGRKRGGNSQREGRGDLCSRKKKSVVAPGRPQTKKRRGKKKGRRLGRGEEERRGGGGGIFDGKKGPAEAEGAAVKGERGGKKKKKKRHVAMEIPRKGEKKGGVGEFSRPKRDW